MSPSATTVISPRDAHEKEQNNASQHRAIHDRLRHNLSIAIGAKDAAQGQRVMTMQDRMIGDEERLRRLTKHDAEIAAAEKAVNEANLNLLRFEAAEEFRKLGRPGEIIAALVVTVDQLTEQHGQMKALIEQMAAEIAELKRRIGANT